MTIYAPLFPSRFLVNPAAKQRSTGNEMMCANALWVRHLSTLHERSSHSSAPRSSHKFTRMRCTQYVKINLFHRTSEKHLSNTIFYFSPDLSRR